MQYISIIKIPNNGIPSNIIHQNNIEVILDTIINTAVKPTSNKNKPDNDISCILDPNYW